jgi:putative transposase
VLSEHGIKISPSTYYEYLHRTATGPTAGERREEFLKVEVARVHQANFVVCGARTVWLQWNREGISVARCTVERLMRDLGLVGVVRGKVKKTTVAEPDHHRADGLVGRRFAPLAPDRLWALRS